jgi:hypothetical protein
MLLTVRSIRQNLPTAALVFNRRTEMDDDAEKWFRAYIRGCLVIDSPQTRETLALCPLDQVEIAQKELQELWNQSCECGNFLLRILSEAAQVEKAIMQGKQR